MLLRWLLHEHVVSGAEVGWSDYQRRRKSDFHLLLHSWHLWLLYQSLYPSIRLDRIDLHCWSDGHRFRDRLLQPSRVKGVLAVDLE